MVFLTWNANLPFTIPQWLPSKISLVVIKPPFFFSYQAGPNFLCPHLLHIFFFLSGFENHVSTPNDTCPCVLPRDCASTRFSITIPRQCLLWASCQPYSWSMTYSSLGWGIYLPSHRIPWACSGKSVSYHNRAECTEHFHEEAHQVMSDQLRT